MELETAVEEENIRDNPVLLLMIDLKGEHRLPDIDKAAREKSRVLLEYQDDVSELVVNALGDKYAQPVLYRYGFLDGEWKTVSQVAEEYGGTSDRMRSILHHMKRKLRHDHLVSRRMNVLSDLVNQYLP